MEPRLHFLFILIATFRVTFPQLAVSRDISDREIILLQEPDEKYLIVKKKPATITCRARYAADISFSCGGTKIPPTSIEVEDMSDTDPNVIQASIEVTRADVHNFESSDDTPYTCDCSALGFDDQAVVTSRRAVVKVAHLKHKFTIEPIGTAAIVGEDIELICGAPFGEPRPTIIWRKNKKRVHIKSNDRYQMSDRGSLVIQNIQLEDAGNYQCIARNMAGRRESQEAKVDVSVLAEASEAEEEVSKERKPRQSQEAEFLVKPDPEYEVVENETFSIDCSAKFAKIITFRCNSERMDKGRLQTVDEEDAEGNPVLKSKLNLSYEFVKNYLDDRRIENKDAIFQCQCVAWFHDDKSQGGWKPLPSDRDHGKVTVLYLDKVLKKAPEGTTVGVGYEAKLMCEPPEGNPKPWVFWLKDRQRIDPRAERRYHIDEKGSLIIRRTEYEDQGYYSCVAENKVQRVQSEPAQLIIQAEPPATTSAPATTKATGALEFPAVIPDEPTWIQDLEAENFIKDGTATLVCTVVSAGQLSIECNHRRLGRNDYKLKKKRDKDTDKLLLSITTQIGAGDLAESPTGYFCVCTAWLFEGKSWTKILSNKGFVKEKIENYLEEDFVYPPSDVEAYYEGDAELACEPPKGFPIPRVHWLKDGVRIDPQRDTNFVVLAAGSLVIEYVRLQDEGSYSCVAENTAGSQSSAPAMLTILGKPTSPTPIPETTPSFTSPGDSTTDYDSTAGITEPIFTLEPEESNYIIHDEDVELKCSVVYARSLLFSCNGETVQESARTGFSMTDPRSGIQVLENTLKITAQMVEDFRSKDPYTCVCQGFFVPQGETELVYLESRAATIQKAFLRRRFKQEPQDTTGQLGSSVELTCIPPEGVPKPTILWIKDGFEISDSTKYTITGDGILTIHQLEESDAGAYTCSAKNMIRTRTSNSVMVTISTEGSIDQTDAPVVASPEPDLEPDPEPEPEPETSSPEPEPTEVIPLGGSPFISKDLHSVYYVIRNRPTTILCEASQAIDIKFNCGMRDIPDVQIRKSVKEGILESGEPGYVDVVEGTITVTKQDVEDYGDELYCVCRAHYNIPEDAPADERGYIESQRGYIEVAYLKKAFIQEPEDRQIQEGEFLSIPCQPPNGNPPPTVSWLKNGVPIETSTIGQGAFIVYSATMDENGEYVCVAENEAARRLSQSVRVQVLPFESGTNGGMTDSGTDTTGGVTDATDETDTDDTIIEVEVITNVPLTTDEYGDYSTTDFTYSPSETSEPPYEETSTKGDDVDTQDTITKTTDIETTLETTEEDSSTMTKTGNPTTVEQEESTSDFFTETATSDQADKTTSFVLIEGNGDNSHTSTEQGSPEPEPTSNPDFNEDSTVVDPTFESKSETDESYTINIKEGMNTDNPYPEPDTSTMGEEKDMYVKEGGEMDDDKKMCTDMVVDCATKISSDHDLATRCSGFHGYEKCIADFIDQCTGIISDKSISAAQEATEEERRRCEMLDKCKRLNECRTIYNNAMDYRALPMEAFCSNVGSFIRCADDTLADCDIAMEPPNESGHDSLSSIEEWFNDYCSQMVYGSPSLLSCEDINQCTLPIELAAESNTTYWCRLLDSLVGCTDFSVSQCEMMELDQSWAALKMRVEHACYQDYVSMPNENSPDPTSDSTAEPIVDPDDDSDEAGASTGDNDAAISLTSSFLLVTLTQVVVTAVLSQR